MSEFNEIAAWNSEYKGDSPSYFIQTLEDAAVKRDGFSFANYFAVVQSSGTGKSRLADEVAKQIFTIPICLSKRATNYPPADKDARDNLVQIAETSDDIERHVKYIAYFSNLFISAKENVDKLLKPLVGKGKSKKLDFKTLSEHWRDLLYANRFANRRAMFLRCNGEVVNAKQLDKSSYRHQRNRLINAVKELLSAIRNLSSTPVPFIILSIDEVDTLMINDELDNKKIERYITLLQALNSGNIPSVYITVQSSAGKVFDVAPPGSILQHILKESFTYIQIPFTELDFDANVAPIHDSQLHLQQICTSEFVSQFGRSLFKVAYDNGLKDHIVPFTMTKLLGGIQKLVYDASGLQDPAIRAAIVACMDVRFLLSHSHYRLLPLADEQMQISSNLRHIHVLPAHREFLFSGYALEPLVAEAAANLLRLERPENVINTLEIADRLYNHFFEAKGERGEFISRFLVMAAHDKAAVLYTSPIDPQLNYSRPVRVIDFLKCLFQEQRHSDLLGALPEMPTLDEKPLEEAFENAYINFTQFCRAADKGVCHIKFAWQGLVRGVAIQCCETQEGTDLVIPIVFSPKGGELGHTVLGSPFVSAIMIQVKNRQDKKRVYLNINNLKFFEEEEDGEVDEGKEDEGQEDKGEGDEGEEDEGEEEGGEEDEGEEDEGEEDDGRNDDNDNRDSEDESEDKSKEGNKSADDKRLKKHPYIFIVMKLGFSTKDTTKQFDVRTKARERVIKERSAKNKGAKKTAHHPQYKIVVTGLQDVYEGIGEHEASIMQNVLSTTPYTGAYSRVGESREKGLVYVKKTGIAVHGDQNLIPSEK